MTPQSAPPDLPNLTFVRGLGSGGYAQVFLYEQSNPRMLVAVKVLADEGLSEHARESFAAEANAMAELADHPNIVQVFRTDITADGRPYLVMKYYPQQNLLDRAQAERLSVPEVLRIGIRIACAVETAHRAGILHRDIKPANILTSQYGEPGLADFGISTLIGGDGAAEAEGVSVPWAPPEALFGTSPADATSDVYSLGATLWHLLVGRSPFVVQGGDNTSFALMRRIREQPVPRTGRDEVPVSLERLLTQSMSKRSVDRPQSALAFARALQEIEREQRWPTTSLVLLETPIDTGQESFQVVEVLAPEVAEKSVPQENGSETRIRSPQTVVPRAPQPPMGAESVNDSSLLSGPTAARVQAMPPSRAREGILQPGEESGTIRRAKVVADQPVDHGESAESPPRGSRRLVLIAGAVVLAIAAIGLVVVLSSPTNKGKGTLTTISSPPPTLPAAAPSGPIVTASRVDAGHIEFSWSEADPRKGQDFEWQEEGSTQWTPASGNSVVLPDPAGTQLCIVVQVGQADNTETAQSTKCAS